jgi:peroxiredoxin Q/BCP
VRKLVGGNAEGVPTKGAVKKSEDKEAAKTADEVADTAEKMDTV